MMRLIRGNLLRTVQKRFVIISSQNEGKEAVKLHVFVTNKGIDHLSSNKQDVWILLVIYSHSVVTGSSHLKKKSVSVILVIIFNTTKAKYLLSFQKQHHTDGIMLYTIRGYLESFQNYSVQETLLDNTDTAFNLPQYFIFICFIEYQFNFMLVIQQIRTNKTKN